MNVTPRKIIGVPRPVVRLFSRADVLLIIGLALALFLAIRFASGAGVRGPDINLAPSALPYYTLLSLTRMFIAYIFSFGFALVYGYYAAKHRAAERVLLPVLDVLAAVPLLSFLPVVLLAATTILPGTTAIEITAVLLIFSSQAWNMVYSFYQSTRALPVNLQEAAASFRFNWWYRFRYLELPFGARGLLWNSVTSWANGWFFLMAAETFRVADRDYRLPGLGAYLQAAAEASDVGAVLAGMGALVLVIVLMDQFIWRPLLTWADKFKADLAESDDLPGSWFFDLAGRSRLATGGVSAVVNTAFWWLDKRLGRALQPPKPRRTLKNAALRRVLAVALALGGVLVLGGGLFAIGQTLVQVSLGEWGDILAATLATGARIALATGISLAWTIPVGVLIGTNQRLTNIFQPIVQIVASIPATGLFPVVVLALINSPIGLNGAAIILMLLGTQWYLLFNVIAGASALPQELKDITTMFRIDGWLRWRALILPTLFPYILTGAVSTSAGAWNATIVAEYTEFGGRAYTVNGLGAIIAQAAAGAQYPLLLAATLTMIAVVVGLNRFFWRPLFVLAEEKYNLDERA